MSTYTALHIQSDEALVEPLLVDWLKSIHQVPSVSVAKQREFPLNLYGDDFAWEDPPTMLAVGSEQLGWVTVYYNSFYEMRDIAAEVSRVLKCLTVVVMAQSVSEAYFLCIHRDGGHLRTLQWVGDQGEWMIQDGEPLPFEKRPLGRNISEEGDEPFYIFERDEVLEYCSNLGLELWNDADVSSWTVLMVEGT